MLGAILPRVARNFQIAAVMRRAPLLAALREFRRIIGESAHGALVTHAPSIA